MPTPFTFAVIRPCSARVAATYSRHSERVCGGSSSGSGGGGGVNGGISVKRMWMETVVFVSIRRPSYVLCGSMKTSRRGAHVNVYLCKREIREV